MTDEVNSMSASTLAEMHQTMMQVFNHKRKKVASSELPFGGKKMAFLGDPVQLKSVMGEPTYSGGTAGPVHADMLVADVKQCTTRWQKVKNCILSICSLTVLCFAEDRGVVGCCNRYEIGYGT